MVFEKPVENTSEVTSELVKRINEDTRRIRTLEQRMDRIENSMSTLEETLLAQMGELTISLERISKRIADVAEKITTMENEILRINKELGKTATKTEVKQLETFIDLVNPITAKFVTKDELDRRLEGLTAKKT